MKITFCFKSQPISDANDEISLVKNYRSRSLIGRTMFFTTLVKNDRTASYVILGTKPLVSRLFISKMSERFVDVGSVDNFIVEQENKAILQKNTTRCKTLANFFSNQE